MQQTDGKKVHQAIFRSSKCQMKAITVPIYWKNELVISLSNSFQKYKYNQIIIPSVNQLFMVWIHIWIKIAHAEILANLPYEDHNASWRPLFQQQTDQTMCKQV